MNRSPDITFPCPLIANEVGTPVPLATLATVISFEESAKSTFSIRVKAANEKIAIVGPTTLIAILQIISRIWSSKRQSEATNLIISAATEIYDKTRLVGDAFEDFEKSLEQANKSIASGKTRTKNLVSKVEKMRTIGGLEPTKDISDKLRVIDKE